MGSYTNTKRGRKTDMKVVKIFEINLKDQDEMFEKWGKYLEKAAKNPEKYPKYIFGPAMIAKTDESIKGVSIMEIDNDEQIINYLLELAPPLKAEFKLLYDGMQYVGAYMAKK